MTEPIATEPSASQAPASPDKVSSSADDQVQVFSDAQLEQLEGIVNKRVQKTTDKRFQQTNNKLTGISETLQKVKDVQEQYGVTQEQAVSIIERDAKIDEVLSRDPGVQEPSAGTGEDMSVLAKSILTGAGADPTSDAAQAFVNTLVGKPSEEFATELGKWAVGRKERPQAGAGNLVASGGHQSSGTAMETLEARMVELKKLPMSAENMAKRNAVLKEMEQYD